MGKKDIYASAKVLVVDDNQINLYVFRKVFEQLGVKAECACGGDECIKKVSEKVYDLIFMDHVMPDKDGIETFQLLKETNNKDVPVIVMSASYDKELENQFMKVGFAGYIIKPVENDKLDQVLSRYLLENEVTRSELGL